MDFALRSDPLEILTLSILHALCVWQKVWKPIGKTTRRKLTTGGNTGGRGWLFILFLLVGQIEIGKMLQVFHIQIQLGEFHNINDCQILCLQAVLLVEQDTTQLPDSFLD